MRLSQLACVALLGAAVPAQGPDPHIRIDQFGYRPTARKVAILRTPIQGFDTPAPFFAPSPQVEVRAATTQAVVWSGAPVAWNGGAVDSTSGDRVWWLDFSALQTPGDYYLFDPQSGSQSAPFTIAADVYRPVLKQAMRMFFYQRCGVAKALPFAGANWTDGACHLHSEQDLDCRSVLNPVPATSRDLHGGWHDAGDYNKYVNYADEPVNALLDAYLDAPAYWTDDYDLPESGNGVPDILDEVKVELDWLLRMQNQDGSVPHKISATSWVAMSPASIDPPPRRYAPATASATATCAHVFAHAAVAFATRPEPALQAYSQQLLTAATAAWNWLVANPTLIPSNYDNQGFLNVACEDDPYTQDMQRLAASAWLFAATGNPTYRTWFDAHYQQSHLFLWSWASPWEAWTHAAILAYTEAAGCTQAVAATIRQLFAATVTSPSHLGHHTSGDDAYLAFLEPTYHTWGSNSTKCMEGLHYLLANRYGLAPASARALCDAAESYVHYIHGLNPLGYCFLTNLKGLGAEGSVDEMYHAWFGDGTPYDNAITSPLGPAPGYLTGGVNPYWQPDPQYSGPPLVPPGNQPPLKSYRDWNTDWPEASWEITEPAIGYQGHYVRLLAAFATQPAPALAVGLGEITTGAATTLTLGGAHQGGLVVTLLALGRSRVAVDLGFWNVDLGLDLLPSPSANILGVTVANTLGLSTIALPALPAATQGLRITLQASEIVGGEPLSSPVVERTIR